MKNPPNFQTDENVEKVIELVITGRPCTIDLGLGFKKFNQKYMNKMLLFVIESCHALIQYGHEL